VTIGFHSPMPPARTGVADYSAALVAALRRRYARVEVNPAGGCDAEVYSLGNNPLHRDIYRRSLQRPGVAILHDAVLHHFFLGYNDERTYVDELVYNCGEWHRGTARSLWRDRAHSGHDPAYFRHPMLARVGDTARAIVVHNPAAAEMARRRAPVVEIPHLFEPPPPVDAVKVIETRQPWGRFVFGVFGYLRESKRVHEVCRAFARVRAARYDVGLVIAGEWVSADLARSMDPLLRQPGVVRVPHLSEAEFWTHAHAVDCCINLRYPTAGETSGIGVRLMGIGKPVMFTAGREIARIPETARIAIEPGQAEHDHLVASMLWLADNPEHARRIGRQAAAHIAEHHDPDSVARSLVAVAQAAGTDILAG
jgi:glycosyltransferase involved in cell wall biosynthesis